jgi:hypothetical protein
VHPDAGRKRRHLLVKPVPARDLERDQPYFPRSRRNGEWTFDMPHLQHVDGARAERDRLADRDGID